MPLLDSNDERPVTENFMPTSFDNMIQTTEWLNLYVKSI